MGDTLRLQIADAFVDALKAASLTLHAGTAQERTDYPPEGLNVHRARLRPTERDQLPAQVVYFLSEPTPDPDITDLVDRVLRIGVESRVRVHDPNEDAPDDVLDPLVAWAQKAVMADETLGGLCQHIEEAGGEWVFEEGREVFGRQALVFHVHYQTRRNDPELAT